MSQLSAVSTLKPMAFIVSSAMYIPRLVIISGILIGLLPVLLTDSFWSCFCLAIGPAVFAMGCIYMIKKYYDQKRSLSSREPPFRAVASSSPSMEIPRGTLSPSDRDKLLSLISREKRDKYYHMDKYEILRALVRDNERNAVQWLLNNLKSYGLDINAKEPLAHATALHLAVMTDNGEMVQLLIDAGADVNARIKSGLSPIDLAIHNGKINCLRYFLKFCTREHLTRALQLESQLKKEKESELPPQAEEEEANARIISLLLNKFGMRHPD